MLNFLANLGSGAASIGRGFAHGAASVGKGIGRGFKRLGELGEDEMAPEPYQTPPFIPREESGRGRSMMEIVAPADRRLTGGADPYAPRPGIRGLEDAVVAAENDARADSLIERRNLPITPSPIAGGPPPLTPAPSLEELRTAPPGPPVLAPRGGMALNVATPGTGPGLSPAFKPEPMRDYRGREIRGEIDFARDQSVRKGMDEGGGFRRGAGMALKNAFLAASQIARGGDLGEALGGALAAGAGSLINPRAGYEFAFDVGERPKMEAEMARERAAKARAMEDAINLAKLGGMEAETRLKGAQADESRANIEFRSKDQELKRLKEESDARLKAAEIEATLTGQAKLTKIFNPETGQIEEVWTFPGGRKVPVGPSGDVELAKLKEKAETDRMKYRESADTGREAMRQAGQNQRQQIDISAQKELAEGVGGSELERPSAQGGQGGKTWTTRAEAKAQLIANGFSDAKAEQELNRLGIK
jgi:hypothetical protein